LNKKTVNDLLFFIAMLFAMSFWGGAWVSAKKISLAVTPDVIVFLRFFLTFVSFFVLLLFSRRENRYRVSPNKILWILIPALFYVLYNRFFFEGIKIGLAGKGGVIVTTLNPLFTFILTITFLKHTVSRLQIFGLCVGLTGGIILLEFWNINYTELVKSGNLYFVTCALTWALVTIMTQYAQKEFDLITYCFYLYGVMTFISFFLTRIESLAALWNQNPVFWAHVLFLSLGAITYSTTVYFYASKKLGSNRASSFTFIVPFTAVSLSWLFLNETPSIYTIAGGLLALLAIYIINFQSFFSKMRAYRNDDTGKE